MLDNYKEYCVPYRIIIEYKYDEQENLIYFKWEGGEIKYSYILESGDMVPFYDEDVKISTIVYCVLKAVTFHFNTDAPVRHIIEKGTVQLPWVVVVPSSDEVPF